MTRELISESNDQGIVRRAFYGAEGTGVRATWRVAIPLVAGLVVYLGGQIAVQSLASLFISDVAGNTAVILTLVVLTVLAIVIVTSGLLALVVATRLDERSYASYGFERSSQWGREFLVGIVIGVIASTGAILYQSGRGFATLQMETTGTGADSIFLGILVVIVTLVFYLSNNVFEEVLFRAIFIKNSAEGLRSRSLGVLPAVVLASAVSTLLFGLLHLLGEGGINDVVTSSVAGILFAVAYVLTGRLSLPIGVHFGGVFIVTFLQERVSQNSELTLPSLFVVEGIETGSTVEVVELWAVRAAIGVLLICMWVYYSCGGLSIAEEVYTRTDRGQ